MVDVADVGLSRLKPRPFSAYIPTTKFFVAYIPITKNFVVETKEVSWFKTQISGPKKPEETDWSWVDGNWDIL